MLETYTNQTNTITLTEIKKKAVGTQLIDHYYFLRDDGKKIEMPQPSGNQRRGRSGLSVDKFYLHI